MTIKDWVRLEYEKMKGGSDNILKWCSIIFGNDVLVVLQFEQRSIYFTDWIYILVVGYYVIYACSEFG